MVILLTNLPLWLSGLLLVGLTTAIAMCGPAIMRRFVSLEGLTTNNEVAGFKFATVGVLYAVFLAFAIILVWQKFSDAESTATREAGAVASIYHLSYGIDAAPGAGLRAALANYVKVVTADEWPAMGEGRESPAAESALKAVYAALLACNSPEQRGSALMSELFYQLDVLTQARRARLLAAEGAVPAIVWIVLYGGAVLTITFTLFFGTRNLRAQMLMTGLLSLLIFAELLIVVAIDRPFAGSVKVEPNALTETLASLSR